jgi:antitoxin component YwqK of YwqJK toxin-antitoxin module
MEGWIRDGKNAGVWNYYYENGTLSMKGKIFDNIRQGKWAYYYENGQPKMEGSFREDKKDGIWNYFYEDGALKAQAFYTRNRGWYKEFYPSEKLKAEGLNINGKSDSTWTFYHESGQLKACGNYENGMRVGPWEFYHDNGMKSAHGTYIQGTRDGKWTFYHDNGEISSEGALREDKKEGYWKIFNEEGRFIAEGLFEEDDGIYKEYYASGKLKAKGQIDNGKNHGIWHYYFENGELEGECLYDQGSGEYVGYYADGTVKMKGPVKDGVNTGVWELYNGDGSLAGYYRPYYEDDKPIYKLVEQGMGERLNYTKPEYKYKNYKMRYFDAVINEYRGIIIATNPLATVIGSLPLSVEYYYQERLGYELQVRWLNEPFYKNKKKIESGELYQKGFDIALKQKFYHPDGKFGMFYFGHEVRLTSLNHMSNAIDSTTTIEQPITLKAHETKFEYSFIVGDRWMTIYGERWRRNSVGITLDLFAGLGIGYRLLDEQYPNEPEYNEIFKDLNDSNFAFSPRLGIHLGIIF